RARDAGQEDVAATRCALAMCENIDMNVGRVLQRLAEVELTEPTIVIYFSRNGPNGVRWNGGMKGVKGSIDEGGVRAPFVIRWPGKIPGSVRVPKIAGAIDLLPPLASLAGVGLTNEKPLDGKDLSPLLLGTARDWPERMIFSHQNGKVSVRTQQHRLDDRGGLFDMIADPGQATDIAQKQTAPATKTPQGLATV